MAGKALEIVPGGSQSPQNDVSPMERLIARVALLEADMAVIMAKVQMVLASCETHAQAAETSLRRTRVSEVRIRDALEALTGGSV